MRGRSRHAAAFGVAALLFAAGASAQRAAPDTARARDAFERGSAAYRLGDYARAAAEYARADALDPNPAALRAALDAATLADDTVLGEELIERAERMPGDSPGSKALDAARARFAHRTGHVVVRCSPGGTSGTCLATVDGVPFDTSQPKVVTAGPHTVLVQTDGAPEARIVSVSADAILEIDARAPGTAASPPPSRPPVANGVESSASSAPPSRAESRSDPFPTPTVFFVALGATALAGGVTTWSALDTRSRHTTFARDCGAEPSTDCGALQSEGRSAETRTNVLLAVSGAFAVTTAVLGVLVHGRTRPGETVALAPYGAGMSLRVGF